MSQERSARTPSEESKKSLNQVARVANLTFPDDHSLPTLSLQFQKVPFVPSNIT
jgi:hypothetical protein